jgi:hypothetical protein
MIEEVELPFPVKVGKCIYCSAAEDLSDEHVIRSGSDRGAEQWSMESSIGYRSHTSLLGVTRRPRRTTLRMPYVWVFPKAGGEGRRKAPQNVFWETDMYAIRTGEEGRDLRLEKGLSGLESDFAGLRREKLEDHAALDAADQVTLAAFVAAMQARSRTQREHWRSQFSDLLATMDQVHESMMQKSSEEREHIATLSAPVDDRPSLGREEVAALAEAPLQQILPIALEAKLSMLLGMDLAVIETNDQPGFISSDAPCVIFDPAARERPFPFNVPGLIYPTVEVTLPISPRQLVVYNRRGLHGYQMTTPAIVDELLRLVV